MELKAALKTDVMKTFWDLAKTDRSEMQALQKDLKVDAAAHRLEQALNSKSSKASSGKLTELTSSKAPAGTIREGDAFKQEQDVEKAKLKNSQLKESKALYAKQEEQKKNFEKHQSEVREKFLAKKPSKEQIASFEKVQSSDKKTFEAGLVKENVALYNKHQAQNKDQAKWHATQQQALNSKYASKPAAKPSVTKPNAKPATTAPKAAAKPVAVVEIPVQDCSSAGLSDCPVPTSSKTETFTFKGKTIIEESYSKPLSGKGMIQA